MNGYKIIATQIVAAIAAVLALIGVPLSPEEQASVVTTILIVCNVVTIIWRLWFTDKEKQ